MICRSCHLEHAPTLGCMVAARQEIFRQRDEIKALRAEIVALQRPPAPVALHNDCPECARRRAQTLNRVRRVRARKTGSEKVLVSAGEISG